MKITFSQIFILLFLTSMSFSNSLKGQQILDKTATVNLQSYPVSGLVTDKSGESLPGVSVTEKGTSNGAITDVNGKFRLSVKDENAIIVFSYIGYKIKEVPVDSRGEVNVILEVNSENLDEVVVMGYGTQRKSNLTGAVTTINAKALANRPITNASQALQGASGVYVNQTSGRPGADGATLRVRGIGTLNDNNPLILVDGVEYPLGSVNPADIESISVLKDAASSAIYGSRAANGVILVTTKKGIKGKSQVDYSYYTGVQSITFKPDVVSNAIDYMTGKNRALANEGKPAEYTTALLDEYRNGTDPYIYSNTNWFDVMFENAPIQEHSLRFSGGSDKTLFSISGGYLDQDGILINTGAKRYTLTSNVSSEINKRIKVGATIAGNMWNITESSYTSNDANGEGGIMGLLYRGLPMQVPYAQDGSYADQWFRVPGHNVFRNTLALSYEGYKRDATFRGLGNVFAEITLPFNLTYRVTGGVNTGFNLRKYARPQIMLTNPKTGVVTAMGNIPSRGVQEESISELNLTNFHTLNWSKKFGAHQLNSLGGFSIETFDDKNFSASVQGYLDNSLTEIDAGSTTPVVGGKSSRASLMSYFGRVNYSFSDKYLAEANFRYDGSSKFAEGNQWGFFPSFSAGWIISEEEFLKNNKFVTNLKIRASWGQLGNQKIASFAFVDPIAFYPYSFGTTVVSGAAASGLGNRDITWETTSMANIGLDAGFFNNRLTAEFEYFDKKTSDILLQIPVPGQVGNLPGPFKNIGVVSNKGIELTLGYRDKSRGVSYNVAANVTYVKNKVEGLNVAPINGTGREFGTIILQGLPIRSFYGLQAEGLFQSDSEVASHAFQSASTKAGDIKYKDVDGNKKIDNADRVVIGNGNPAYNCSLVLGAGFKGFELSAIMQGSLNVDTYNRGNLSQPFRNGAGVTKEWLTDSWTPENPGASLPRLTTSTGFPQNFLTSSYWVQDASYLRLKNVQLSYTIPQKWVQLMNVFVNAQNYMTISKFKLGDPERNTTRTDLIEYPNNKMVTAGLNVAF